MKSPFLKGDCYGSPIRSVIVNLDNPNREARRALARQAKERAPDRARSQLLDKSTVTTKGSVSK